MCLSPSKKTLHHFRTQMLSLLSNTSKKHLVKGMIILYKKGNLSFWQELIFLFNRLYEESFLSQFCRNHVQKGSTRDKCQQTFRVCNFHFKITATLQKAQENPKQLLTLPSVKKFVNSLQAKQSAFEGLRFYYQDIRLNRSIFQKDMTI